MILWFSCILSLVLVHVMFNAGVKLCKTQIGLTGGGEEGVLLLVTQGETDHKSKFTTEQQQHVLC